MNFNSIITKLIFIFFIVIGLFIAIGIGYYFFENAQQHQKVSQGYRKISTYTRDNMLQRKELTAYVQSLGFKQVEDHRVILEAQAITLSGPGYESIHQNSDFYLSLHTPFQRYLFKDLNVYDKNYTGLFIIAFLFIIVSSVFIWIIKTLQPLKKLKNEIQDFANGNLNIECKSDKKDEIAQVANEFDNAVKKISLLLESRQLFLRTVMHELKTPIAKGKIVCALIDDTIQKNRISTIFDKLNFLIDDFAKTEQVISKNYKIHKNPYSLGSILNNAKHMLMRDDIESNIRVSKLSDQKLLVDIDLFSLALKNLLDNALKYSTDTKVEILEENNSLIINSHGKELPKPLDDYFKPFHNDTKQKNHGMGLGLYIVNSIIEMHGMKLNYRYKNEINSFIIQFSS